MTTKDLFSGHANLYAAFRPTYPEELYQFIFQFVPGKGIAWDCGTGNGQVAQRLAQTFTKVYATDLSEKQIAEAVRHPNIEYSVSSAEKTSFPDSTFDLITVAQALHWFNTDAFYREVRRVASPDATLAFWGYGNITINAELDAHIQHFYSRVVGEFWDSARHHVETEYRDIPFPFTMIESPRFHIQQRWTLDHLCGYLESWSATQRYIAERHSNPVKELRSVLRASWGAEDTLTVRFPVFLKLGRV